MTEAIEILFDATEEDVIAYYMSYLAGREPWRPARKRDVLTLLAFLPLAALMYFTFSWPFALCVALFGLIYGAVLVGYKTRRARRRQAEKIGRLVGSNVGPERVRIDATGVQLESRLGQ